MLAIGKEIRYRIVPILEVHWEEFFQAHKGWIRPVVLETVRKLRACRTPALGRHLYQCPECKRYEVVPHTCKSRFCPSCGKHATDRSFLGTDSTGAVIAHWMDSFGAAFSIPHATGAAFADTVRILFRYPDAPFRDTFVYDRSADSWYFRMESGDPTGGAWSLFAEYDVRRR